MGTRTKLFLCALILGLSFMGCYPNTSDPLVESYQALERVMTRHASDPEALMPALDEVISKYRQIWLNAHHSIENAPMDFVVHEYQTREQKLAEPMARIVDLDLEIQDALEAKPEYLAAYRERIRQIGR